MVMIKKYFLVFCFLPALLCAQVSGVIRDEKKKPIAFATVYIKNTSIGTVSNEKGFFQLQAPSGEQEIIVRYLGYKEQAVKVQVEDKAVKLNISMEPSDYALTEVVISSEDPAMGIMRKVIEKRKYYKSKLKDHACDAYIKGLFRIMDAPHKMLGIKVGDMDGMLDSSRTGILYFSESVSKLYVQSDPLKKKEVMISSKISGESQGYSMNRATLTDFNLYDELISIDREMLSPLADNAFNYYRFVLIGKHRNLYGYEVYKIKVIPKRSSDPTFSGFLYVVDDYWNLAEADLYATGASLKQPILDTMRIQQSFVPITLPDSWALLTQFTSFKFGVLGLKIGGYFNSVFSNYNMDPAFTRDFFNREEFKVEADASRKDLSYWKEVRPIPLTEEEEQDYIKKDSIGQIRNSRAYMDSMDRRNNRFRVPNLIMGYTWENSWKKRSVSYPPLFQGLQFNTVQGVVVNFEPELEFRQGNSRNFTRLSGNLNYGFSEEKLRGGLSYEQQFESIHYSKVKLEAGVSVAQFNARKPIGPLLNSLYSLFREENYMKLYDSRYIRAQWSRILSPFWSLAASVNWEDRRRLVNRTSYSWNKNEERQYSVNEPATGADALGFPQVLSLEFDLRLQFKQTYTSYPEYRSYSPGNLPQIGFKYKKALAGIGHTAANYDLLQLKINQNGLSWGLAGYSNWSVKAGSFVNNRRMGFMDFYHPQGNQTLFSKLEAYDDTFFQLPYYSMSTQRNYAEAHWQHHLEGWLIDKIPVLRRLNLKEVFGLKAYYSSNPVNNSSQDANLYWECNAGFTNIGFNAFRFFRLDFSAAFQGKKYLSPGLVIGVGF